jgi:hypothetical protein
MESIASCGISKDVSLGKTQKRYATASQVRERYGGRSAMWLWRRMKDDPRFPKPLVIAKRLYFDLDLLDAYDQGARRSSDENATA